MLVQRTNRGFTIVELLIVVVVIAILAAITIVAFNGITKRAQESAVQSSASQAGKKLATYSIDNNGQYPAQLADVGIQNSSSVTYQYTTSAVSGKSMYCLTTTSGNAASHIAANGNTTPGPCPGHTGTAPPLLSCPSNYITVPGNSLFGTNSFCTMKYEAKNDGSNNAVSVAAGTPWVSISQVDAITKAQEACSGCHLMTEAEWLTIAHNAANVSSNWISGVVGSGQMYRGHTDGDPAARVAASTNDSDGYYNTNSAGDGQRRTLTLSNGEVLWDFAGNVYEWTNATVASGAQPGLAGDAAFSWKQWNNPSMLWRDFPLSALPSYGTPAAASWTSDTQRIGLFYTNYNDAAGITGYKRGGYWDNNNNAGVFALGISSVPTSVAGTGGFRVAR